MSEIALYPTSANCVTCVPDFFIDNCMVEANGEYVKIYLYLLRSLGRSTNGFSISSVADALDHTQKDVRKALRYWEKMGLLDLIYDDCHELNSIYLRSPEDISSYNPPNESAHSFNPVVVQPTVDEGFKELLYVAEKLFGHSLSGDIIDKIMYWHDEYNLSWSLIEYIIEYSIDKGASSIQYMDKVALSYANEGIATVEEAKEHNNAYLSVSFAVKRAFGISGRNLGQAELEYIKRWSFEYGFSNEIISEACKRTLLKTHNASFEYANSILSSWRDKQVTTIEDLKTLDKEHERAPKKGAYNSQIHNFSERNEDLEELEKKLLNS